MRTSPILPRVISVAAVVLATAASGGFAGPAAADPGVAPTAALTTPVTDHCPHKTHTPPAVDESETVAPGSTTPTPLPVPARPAGGDKLGGCGVVADPAAGEVPSGLTSAAWLIADLDTGDVIAAKDPHGRYRPASTIKVLLALTAMDELKMDTKVTGTYEDYATEGDSCGMGPEGTYTVEDLLTGLLMVSGNDCAGALARELGGREEALKKMNAKAAALGAHDTRAASPSGLDAAGMSTSPYDEAVIFRAAMHHDEFARIVKLRNYDFPGFPPLKDVPDDKPHPGYMMAVQNPLLRDEYPGMLGGKTGYTDDALKTYVGAVERDGRRLLIVQMFGLSTADDAYAAQAQRMFDYGFAADRSISIGKLSGDEQIAAQQNKGDAVQLTSSGNDESSSSWLATTLGILAGIAALVILYVATVRLRRR